MLHIEEINKHLFVVLCYEHYTPLGVIRSLGENGIRPIVIILENKYRERVASASKYIRAIHRVQTAEEGYSFLMQNYSGEVVKPFVIPCDDKFVEMCDLHYKEMKEHFYVPNALEQPGRITYYQDKNNINILAKKHGLNVAETFVVKRGEIPDGLTYPIITKTLSSKIGGWKGDYHICNNEQELIEAYKTIKGEDLLLQRFIKKKTELCLDGVIVDQGRQWLAIASRYTYTVPDAYSAEMLISNLSSEARYKEIKAALDSMFAEIGYEGIFSLEFMVDEEEKLWFLEENFRASTWSYAATSLGMNLVLLWAEGVLFGRFSEDSEKTVPNGYKAMAEFSDFKYRVLTHKISLSDWIKAVKSTNCFYTYNNKDIKPFVYAITSKSMGALHRKLEKLFRRKSMSDNTGGKWK